MSTQREKELLKKAKELLQDETSNLTYNTWIKPLDIDEINDNHVVIIANSAYAKEVLEEKLKDLITNTFNELLNRECKLTILTSVEASDADFSKPTNSTPQRNNTQLNPKYTFDTLVVGGYNSLAVAAAKAVAKNPANSYNPLFLYGGVGLGKTHIMQAIGNELYKKNPDLNIVYVTSEKFTNQHINAIQENKREVFRNKYRNVDILLIDDIQFIAGKKSVQEEFFHTFNALKDSNKQIVLSSDKPPKDIPDLEERLKTRFEWGLISDIQKPDYETRYAILKKKVQEENIIVDESILSYIATKITNSVRELEGVLTKIIAHASLTNSEITLVMAERAIKDIINLQEKVISAELIQEVVGEYFNINPKELKGSKRSQEIVVPRQIAMYLCRNVAQMSLPNIGKAFGNRDHSTVMHACAKVEKEVKENNTTKSIVDSVKNLLKT